MEDNRDQKFTVEEVIKRHTEYQTGINTRIQETKAFLEGALEREVDTETRSTLSKALESLDALAKMKHPGPMMMEPEEDEEHMKGKKKTKKNEESELAQKSLVEGHLEVREVDYAKQNEVMSEAITKGLEGPLTVLTKALEGIGKMVEGVVKDQEAIKKDLETKASRDEVPNRKGVTKNSTELPKEEDLTKKGEGEGFEAIRKSDAYDKANPQERLRLFAGHFAR